MREWEEYAGDTLDYEEIREREEQRLAAIKAKRAADDAAIEALKHRFIKLASIVVAVFLAVGIVYAASQFYYMSDSQTAPYDSKPIFNFMVNQFFAESGTVSPGESKSINPIVTSDASIDSYAVIVVEMPKYDNGGLYTIDNSDDWILIESWASGDSWCEAYLYKVTLSAGASTTSLGSTITMKEMTNAQYGQLDNLSVTMTAYACGSDEGELLDTAWGAIKTHYGLGE